MAVCQTTTTPKILESAILFLIVLFHLSQELHAEILEQKQVLVNLETESQELAQDQPDSTNVKQIVGQLTNLNGKLRTLEETVITQRNIICKNLNALNRVRDLLKAEREELRAAELRVEAGPPTPATLKESRVKKEEVKVSVCLLFWWGKKKLRIFFCLK